MRLEISTLHWNAIKKITKKISNPQHIIKINNLKINCELNNRMRTNGGDASYVRKEIRLNYRLHKENINEISKTYLHELAHILNFIIFPRHRNSHGWEWESVMFLLDQKPERCHKMDTSKLKNKKVRYVYSCGCKKREYKLTKGKHVNNTVSLSNLRGPRYSCRACNDNLVFSGQTVKI